VCGTPNTNYEAACVCDTEHNSDHDQIARLHMCVCVRARMHMHMQTYVRMCILDAASKLLANVKEVGTSIMIETRSQES
jgi:hypothetical protein